MDRLVILFLLAASAFAQPTVSNVRIAVGPDGVSTLSHSSAQILFDTSAVLSATACGSQFTPGASCWRLRLSTSSCSAGSGGTLYYPDYHAAASLQYAMAMNLSGLTPSTAYFVCPEASSNGTTWGTGAELSFSTTAVPAVHPALPIAPATFTIPAEPAIGGGACGSGSGTCAVPAGDCGNVSTGYQARVNVAIAGDTITIPPGTICNGSYTFPPAPDAKSFLPSAVTTSTSTFNIPSNGLSNDQPVRLGSTGCLPGTIVPSLVNSSQFFNCNNTGGLIPGYTYYAKVSGSNVQLMDAPGGAVKNLGYVQFTATVSGSTITVQPVNYEQSYATLSTGVAFDTTNAFQLSTSGTLPAGLSLDTNYFLKTTCVNVVKCTSQLALSSGGSAVTITNTGSGTHYITTKGTGTHYIAPIPLPSDPYVVIRTSSTNLPPDGVQISPTYQPSMATFRQDLFSFDGADGGGGTLDTTCLITTGPLSHNYRFIGLEMTINATGAADLAGSVAPRVHGNLLCLGQDSANIIVDRVYPHGLGYPDRIGSVVFLWNGRNLAIANSYFDKMDRWRQTTDTDGEGTQTIIAGIGQGPYIFQNNYMSGTGINLHFDDGGHRYATQHADFTVRRNFFNTPRTQQWGGSVSDGHKYGHRQALEVKAGPRVSFDGNRFTGSFMDITRSSHSIEMTPRNGALVSDVSFTNNTIHDANGGFGMNGAVEGLYPVSFPLKRFRVANNLVYNIDGGAAYQTTNNQTSDGVGWANSTGFAAEDYTIENNTFYSLTGLKPSFMDFKWTTMEGFAARNNLVWVGTGTTGISFEGGGEEVQNPSIGSCAGKTGTLALDCALVAGYTFASNVLIPAGSNTESGLEGIYTGMVNRLSLIPTNAAAVGFSSTARNNFRLAASSLFNAGGHLSIGGSNIGADLDALEDAQGLIKNIRPLSIATTSVSIAFHAPDSATACYVGYGTSSDPLTWTRTSADTAASKERGISVTGLSTKTAYYFQVMCAGTAPTTTMNFRTI